MSHIRALGLITLGTVSMTACSDGRDFVGKWGSTTRSDKGVTIDIQKMDDGRFLVEPGPEGASLAATLRAGKLVTPRPIGEITFDRDHNVINAGGLRYLRVTMWRSEGF